MSPSASTELAPRSRLPAPTRRRMILSAAAELFFEKGYLGSNIEDIGAAIGTTGPALYRHFSSKEAILVELIETHLKESRDRAKGALEREGAPRESLLLLVQQTVNAAAIKDRRVVVLANRELNSLTEENRRRFARALRSVESFWVELLQRVEPSLSSHRARCAFHAAMSLIRTLPEIKGSLDAETRELYGSMAMAVLDAACSVSRQEMA